jgi:hypothetical protein
MRMLSEGTQPNVTHPTFDQPPSQIKRTFCLPTAGLASRCGILPPPTPQKRSNIFDLTGSEVRRPKLLYMQLNWKPGIDGGVRPSNLAFCRFQPLGVFAADGVISHPLKRCLLINKDE